MAWCRTGDKPLSEAMLVGVTDANMRHSASMSIRLVDNCKRQQEITTDAVCINLFFITSTVCKELTDFISMIPSLKELIQILPTMNHTHHFQKQLRLISTNILVQPEMHHCTCRTGLYITQSWIKKVGLPSGVKYVSNLNQLWQTLLLYTMLRIMYSSASIMDSAKSWQVRQAGNFYVHHKISTAQNYRRA